MTTSHLIRNMVLTVIVLIAAFFVYRFWWQSPGAAETNSTAPGLVSVAGGSAAGATNPETDRFLYLLLSLQRLELKSDLFASQLFGQLRDFSTALPELTPGRSNPFAPIGVGGVAAAALVTPAAGGGAAAGEPPPAASAGTNNSTSRQQLIESLNQ